MIIVFTILLILYFLLILKPYQDEKNKSKNDPFPIKYYKKRKRFFINKNYKK
jgi:hypothetical protein